MTVATNTNVQSRQGRDRHDSSVARDGARSSAPRLQSRLRSMGYAEGAAALSPSRQTVPAHGSQGADRRSEASELPMVGEEGHALAELFGSKLARDELEAAAAAESDPGRRRTAREAVRAFDHGLVPELRAFLESDAVRLGPQDAVLADWIVRVLQESSVASAERAMGGEPLFDEADHRGRHAWCGIYAAAMMRHGGGFDPALARSMHSEEGVEAFFQTLDGCEVKVGDTWIDVAAYHAARGSSRSWLDVGALQGDPATLDLRPGDVVLLNTLAGERGDHVAQVHTYHPASGLLTTVDGNGSGFIVDPDAERVPGDTTGDGQADLGHVTPRTRDANREQRHPHAESDLGATLQLDRASRGGAEGDSGLGRMTANVYSMADQRSGYFVVHGRGRPSLVDYEVHEYRR